VEVAVTDNSSNTPENARIKELLAELQQALAETDDLDEETLALARELEQNMEDLIGKSEPLAPEMESAIALEAQFAARHPVAEGIMRELIAALGRMGI